jgi:hypothetical protein
VPVDLAVAVAVPLLVLAVPEGLAAVAVVPALTRLPESAERAVAAVEMTAVAAA